MTKEETLQRIRDVGLLTVLRGPSPETTIKIVDAQVVKAAQPQTA